MKALLVRIRIHENKFLSALLGIYAKFFLLRKKINYYIYNYLICRRSHMSKTEYGKIFHLIQTGKSLLLQNQFDLPVYRIVKETGKRFAFLSLEEIKKRIEFYKTNWLGYFPNEFKNLDCIAISDISGLNSKDNIVNDIIGQYFPEKQLILISNNDFKMENAIGGVSIWRTDWNSNVSSIYPSHP